MNFETLKEEFRDHARALQEEKDKTAKFRATSYNKVAELIEEKYSADDKVSKEKIESLELTDYMKKKALDLFDGKKLKAVKSKMVNPKSKKAKSPVKTTTKRAVNVKVKGRAKSKSVSRSPKRLSKSVSRSPKRLSKSPSNPLTPAQLTNLMKELTAFMGIGEERAKQLIKDGLTHINQLHMKKWLSKLPEETQLFLKLKPSNQIPHEDIKRLEPYILKLQNANLSIHLVGSYRRKKETSRDIDIMIVSDDVDIVDKFLVNLNTIVSHAYPYSKGKDKLSIILDVSDLLGKPNTIYKLDAFRVSKENQIPMLLYSTGSKEHNIYMRATAKRKGLLLNQNGLFKKSGDTLHQIDNLNSEEDYFRTLDIPYKEPSKRI